MEYSFSKSFNELDTDGDKRYILNILTFITQYTKGYGRTDRIAKQRRSDPSDQRLSGRRLQAKRYLVHSGH